MVVSGDEVRLDSGLLPVAQFLEPVLHEHRLHGLFIGDRADTLSKSVVLLSVTEDDIAPGTGVAFLRVSDLTG